MDEDEQSRIERGAGGLEKDDKNVRETLFVCFRVFGGIGGCCCFAPAALLCYWGAIFIMAAQREIGVAESIKVTSYIWLTGYASGAIYSVFWCAASFYYQIEYKQVKVRGGGRRTGGAKRRPYYFSTMTNACSSQFEDVEKTRSGFKQ